MTQGRGEKDPARRREALFAEGYGALTGALLEDDVDLADVLDRLVVGALSMLEVDAAAVVLRDQKGNLAPVAASDEHAELLELFQLRVQEGPCLDAIVGSAPVVSEDLPADRHRWPAFVDAALMVGYHSVVALPMSVNGQAVGGLNLFALEPGPLPEERHRIGQSLADLATLAILNQRSARRSAVLSDQLQHALNSRVVIEQAKGVLAERGNISLEAAFDQLRRYARNQNLRLGDVAGQVARGETDLSGD